MFNYIDTTDTLNRAEVVFLNTVNEFKTHLFTDIPKILIIKNGHYNTHSKYLSDIINRSMTVKVEIATTNSFEETNELLSSVARGEYIVYFDPPTITSVSEITRDDWEYNPDIDGILGNYRLNNIVNGSVVPSKIKAIAAIAAKYRTKAEGTVIWGANAETAPMMLEMLKYETYHYAKPITIYGSGRHINTFDLEEKVIIAFDSFTSSNLSSLYRNPKALYIDACYRINAKSYIDSEKFKNYEGRMVDEIAVRRVDRACILYNILNAYKRVAWSRIGMDSAIYRKLDDSLKEIDKILE